jgi:hypothetical protein
LRYPSWRQGFAEAYATPVASAPTRGSSPARPDSVRTPG